MVKRKWRGYLSLALLLFAAAWIALLLISTRQEQGGKRSLDGPEVHGVSAKGAGSELLVLPGINGRVSASGQAALDTQSPEAPTSAHGPNAKPSDQLLFKRLGEFEAETIFSSAPLLDQEWQKASPTVNPDGSERGELVGIPFPALVRREGEGMFAITKANQLPEGLALPAPARVQIDFVPALSADRLRDHHVYLWPLSDSVGRVDSWSMSKADDLRVFVPISSRDLEPVVSLEPRPLAQHLVANDLHAGQRYLIDIVPTKENENTNGSRIEIGKVEFEAPATISLPWHAPPGIEITVGGIGKASGTVYKRKLGPSQDNVIRPFLAHVRNGVGWCNTSDFRDGDYEVWAVGAQWASSGEPLALSILNGEPDKVRLHFVAEPAGFTQVHFDLPEALFDGAWVNYLDAHGKSRSLQDAQTVEDPVYVRWDYPGMYVSALKEPMDLLVYFPAAGAMACLTVVPGERQQVELSVVPSRVFTEALDVARLWIEEGSNPGRTFLEREACASGRTPRWLSIKYFNLALPDVLGYKEGWRVPVQAGIKYRLRTIAESRIRPVPME